MIQKMSHGRENAETLLIVEDDKTLREGLVMSLQAQGYAVLSASDGEEGMRRALDGKADLVILDIMLPGWSGLDILSELRERGNDVPVLILSARDTTASKIDGLELGADDYVTKPFELRELFARVEAILRRRRSEHRLDPTIAFGNVVIHVDSRTVTVAGEPVELSTKEFDLLSMLAKSPGRPFTRDSILDRIWGWEFEGTSRTVDNFVMSLRKKIEADPTEPKHIKTVRQVGYKLDL
jgi:two-component system, OmpR family, alkaline phosphatase synthesis response regulator PhoP